MKTFSIALISLALLISSTYGHGNGRLFDVQVIDGKLVAQGYNSGGNDGAAPIRPYVNSIHDHFNFVGTDAKPLGVTNYPSWDIGILSGSDVAQLVGYELNIELVGSGKWINIPAQDGSGQDQDFGVPELKYFSAKDLQNSSNDIIRIRFNGKDIDTLNLGAFQLSANVEGPTPDLDFEFFIDNHNTTEIYFMEWKLTTNAPGISSSDSVYVIQSPDGVGPVERLHFQSLYLERYLGIDLDKPVVLGDVNVDGNVNLLDVPPFVELMSNGGFQAEADVNQDGSVDLFDVAPFVAILEGG